MISQNKEVILRKFVSTNTSTSILNKSHVKQVLPCDNIFCYVVYIECIVLFQIKESSEMQIKEFKETLQRMEQKFFEEKVSLLPIFVLV